MEEGLRFAIREGGRTVGAGVVAMIIIILRKLGINNVKAKIRIRLKALTTS
jgi:hypothetical protein